MPLAFDKCRSAGGKIRTKELKNGKYIHLCILRGKVYPGEVKKKESASNKYSGALSGK